MTNLNLTAKGRAQELILAYLQENASETLAEKINSGVPVVKDGKTLINKKDLNGFMAFANGEARKLTEKGANSTCVEDSVVYGWAIHYFEEDSIEGKLYHEDSSEYKPEPKTKPKATPTVPCTPPKPKPEPQLSLFDMLGEKKPAGDPKPEEEDGDGEESDDYTLAEVAEEADEEPTEEEIAEIMEQDKKPLVPPPAKQPSSFYRHYLNIQNKYSDAVVALRVGDFYEVLGQNAVSIAKELDMTLTGRDCGLQERVPMIGFPYHAAENYFGKLIGLGYKLAIAEDIATNDITVKEPVLHVDKETGEVLPVEEMRKFDSDIEEPALPVTQPETFDDADDDLPPIDTKAFDLEALSALDELFGNSMILR